MWNVRSLLPALGIAVIASTSALPQPLAAHRAAYDLTLTEPFADGLSTKKQSAVSARGLIGYEFRGSKCEGFTSNFRLAAEIEQSEGEPVRLGQKSMTFEEPNSAGLRFQIEDQSNGQASAVTGYAARQQGGSVAVDLKKPAVAHADLGKNILFPTEHVLTLLAAAEAGRTQLEARVFDGSDTGKKIYQTLSIIGKKLAADATEAAKPLAGHSRWPITISYFDSARSDAEADYIMAFDLYDDGVTGDLKIDYGSFAIAGKLASVQFLPQSACKS